MQRESVFDGSFASSAAYSVCASPSFSSKSFGHPLPRFRSADGNRAQHSMPSPCSIGVPPLESGIDGRGVVLGLVDYGFDILHRPCAADVGLHAVQYIWDRTPA